jgi:hypothetical protein
MKKKEKSEAKMLIRIGKLAGLKATEENFALGLPICYEEDGYLIEEYKNGEKKRIQAIKPANINNAN